MPLMHLQHMEVASPLFYRRKHREGEWPGPIQKPREELRMQIKTLEIQSFFCPDISLNLTSSPI